MKILKKKTEKTWFKFKGKVAFEIRPFRFSASAGETTVEELTTQFMYCLCGWKGLTEEDGKTEFECNDENKMYLFDFYEDVKFFVYEKSREVLNGLDKDIKN